MMIFLAPLAPMLLTGLGATAPAIAHPLAPIRSIVRAAPVESPVQPNLIPILIKTPAPDPQPEPEPQAPVASLKFDSADIIAKAEKALVSVRTARGKFTQQDSYGRASGDFYIQRPGRIRFDYKKPEPMHIVSDGVSVSIEEPERESYDAVPLASTPFAMFLRDDLDLKKDGNVVDISRTDNAYFVTLEDKTGEAQGQMVLEFNPDTFDLVGWRSIDGGGEETWVQLVDVETNVRLRPALFIVRDPADLNDDRR